MSEGSSRPLNVIIAGGGLAGLAAAGYLRAKHNVTVLERDSLNFEKNIKNDYGLSIVANAYKLLLAQGIKNENLEAVIFTHIWSRTQDNDVVSDIVFDTRPRFGVASVFARRSRLQAELYRFATDISRPGKPAQIITDVKIKSVDPIAGVLMTEGGDSYTGDLIIGADGINSSVRIAVLAQSPSFIETRRTNDTSESATVVPSGLIAYVCCVPAEIVSSEPNIAFQAAGANGLCIWKSTEDGRLRIICYPRDDKYFQVVAYALETAWAAEFAKGRSTIIRDVPAERVLKDFEGFHPSIKKILSYSPTSDAWRIRDIEPLDNWMTGKTILIGDAAHAATPHVGQGCNIAIEDAEGLGYLFRDILIPVSSSANAPAPEITKRLSIFQSLRMKRAHLVQFASRQNGELLKDKANAFDPAAFSNLIYGYTGFEDAYKAHLEQER